MREHKEKLIVVLLATIDWLNKFDNISWHGLSPAEAAMDLEIAVDQIRNREMIDIVYLKMLYEVDGLIDTCAKENKWQKDFENLFDDFNLLIKMIK